MASDSIYILVGIIGLVTLYGSIIFWVVRYIRGRKLTKLEEAQSILLHDEKGRQLYIHQSHILMAGFHSATECINCGGNSKTSSDLKKLIVPCSMELSVYDGNKKFIQYTGD